jgi:hypothetical protein
MSSSVCRLVKPHRAASYKPKSSWLPIQCLVCSEVWYLGSCAGTRPLTGFRSKSVSLARETRNAGHTSASVCALFSSVPMAGLTSSFSLLLSPPLGSLFGRPSSPSHPISALCIKLVVSSLQAATAFAATDIMPDSSTSAHDCRVADIALDECSARLSCSFVSICFVDICRQANKHVLIASMQ